MLLCLTQYVCNQCLRILCWYDPSGGDSFRDKMEPSTNRRNILKFTSYVPDRRDHPAKLK